MLSYPTYLQLYNLLGEISALTAKLKTSVGMYASAAEEFLNKFQTLADGQRLSLSSDAAVELQKLVCFDGKNQTRRSARKERDIFAVGCIERIKEKTDRFLEKYDKTFSDCADACRQLAAQITAFDGDILQGENAVDRFISVINSTDSLKPYYVQLVGAVGVFNLRAMIACVLPQTRC